MQYTEVTERFHYLRGGPGELSKDSGGFYRDVKKETQILIDIDGLICEIDIIVRHLKDQAAAYEAFTHVSRRERRQA